MSEGQHAAGDAFDEGVVPAGVPAAPHRSAGNPAAVLLAVERVAADVAALRRGVAAQPEEVAARLDVDAATAAIGVRVGALGSSLDQLRLSLLASLDRAVERLDRLTAAWEESAPDERLARLEQSVSELADAVRADTSAAEADDLGPRVAAIEEIAGRVADDARVLVERVEPMPDRLSAIAAQVDRLTPLARAGDQASSLFDRLDQVETSLEEAIALLRSLGGGEEDDERFEGVIDVLAGVARRQDEVTAAISRVVDQVRGPRNVEAAFDRMEQRERSLAARLDRIDAALRGRGDGGPSSSAEAMPMTVGEAAETMEAVVAAVHQQEQTVTNRLGQIETELRQLGTGGSEETARSLRAVFDRLAQQEATMARHLEWVGERLAEVAAHLVPEEKSGPAPVPFEDRVAGVLGRIEEREEALTARLDQIELELRRLATPTAPDDHAAAAQDDAREAKLAESVESIAATAEDLARLIESTGDRLDHRLSRVESDLAQLSARGEDRAPTDGMSQEAALRLAQLRAERAQVQARLQEERLLAARTWDDEYE